MNTALKDQRELATALVGRAGAVATELAARAGAAEEQRHIHAESFRAIKQADLFRAYTPARFGGHELHPRYFWRIAAEIAKGCPSSAWVYSVMSCHTFVVALFPEQAQEEVFGADPNAGLSGVLPGRTTARLEAARLLTDHACDLCYEAAVNNTGILGSAERARIRMYGVNAMHMCREVVNSLFQDSGGSALHESSRMQRYYRDINAMAMHEAMHDGIIKEVYGRLRLNLPTTHWLL